MRNTLRQTKMEGWFEYYREPCPICHKTGGCIRNEEGDLVGCIRVPSEKYFSRKNSTYLHFLNDGQQQKAVKGNWENTGATTYNSQVTDTLYRSIVQYQLPLLPHHADYLRSAERGLSDFQIETRGYRSITRQLADRIQFPPQVVGLAGFYEENGYKMINHFDGILIPYRNEHNEITGYQVRVENPKNDTSVSNCTIPNFSARVREDGHTVMGLVDGEIIGEEFLQIGEETTFFYEGEIADVKLKKGNRYFWLSSAKKPNGCSPNAPYHIAIPTSRLSQLENSDFRVELTAKSVWITEGACETCSPISLAA